MTSKIIEVVGTSLDEVVNAIRKARDELYFQGQSSLEPKVDPGYGSIAKTADDEELKVKPPKLDKLQLPFYEDDDGVYSGLYFGETD